MFSSRKREKGSPRARPARSTCCSGDIMPFSFHWSNRLSIVTKSFSGRGKWIRSVALDQGAPLRPMSLPILHCNRHVRAENTVEKHRLVRCFLHSVGMDSPVSHTTERQKSVKFGQTYLELA